jgi:hypothetical protein
MAKYFGSNWFLSKEEDMKKPLFALTLGFALIPVANQVWAQPAGALFDVQGWTAGSFLVSVLAGLVLAVGFQILLTILSVACGVSIFGNVEDRFSSPKPSAAPGQSPGISISSGIGLWIMMTTSFSLFFASLLAAKVSMATTSGIGITLGLVIWAAFFIGMTYYEMRKASSILGGIFTTVFSGLKSSAQFVQDILGKTPAEKTAEAIRHELIQAVEDPDLAKRVKRYIKDLQPPDFDWSKAKKELISVLSDFEIKAASRSEGNIDRETFVTLAHKHPHFSKSDVEKLGDLFDEVKSKAKDAAQAPGTGAEKVLNALERLGPGGEDENREIREKFENYLRSAEVDALNPESLKEDLSKIVSDPKSTKQVVLNRIKQFDHPTIVSIVSKKTKLSQEQANQVVNRVESVLESIKNTASTVNEKVDSTVQSATGQKQEARNLKGALEEKIRSYFNSLERPELDYEKIKSDFEQIFHDPKASGEIIKERLRSFDRGSLVALIGSWPNVSEEQAERIVGKIEEARNNIIEKADQIEEKVRIKSQEAKAAALRQAENVRQSVMISAWWLLATAALSACASVLGGVLGLS